MPIIDIEKQSEKDNVTIFKVSISEEESSTEHSVELEKAYYDELTGGQILPEELIKRSFVFLLRNESKEAILKSFNLRQIPDYFPEYEREIISDVGDITEIEEETVHNK